MYMSKSRRNILKQKSHVEYSGVMWTEYHKIELVFYKSCLREHFRKKKLPKMTPR